MTMDAASFIERLEEGITPPTFRIHRYPAGMIDRLSLPGGRAVVLRPILPQDAEAEQRFVTGLSLSSRHKRFHVGLRQLSPGMLRQMTEIDYRDHVALVAQVHDESRASDVEPEIVADARYVRLDGTCEAEFAIAVSDQWQSLGLGRALMARLARHAKAQGLQALVGDVLPENRRMIVLMRGLGATTRPHPDGPSLVQVVFDLANA
jgi:acetyltransferase